MTGGTTEEMACSKISPEQDLDRDVLDEYLGEILKGKTLIVSGDTDEKPKETEEAQG